MRKGKVNSFLLLVCLFVLLVPSMASATVTNDEKAVVNFTALGDSLAAGVLSDNKLGKSFNDYIAEDLNEIELLGTYQKPFTVPGATSMDLLNELQNPQTQAKLQSQNVITISIGANDFLQYLSSDPTKLQNEEFVKILMAELGANYGASLGIIRAINPTAEIYLLGYYNGFHALPAEQQQSLIMLTNAANDVIEAVAGATGSHYVPTFDAIAKDYPTYLPTPSNVHPSSEGYKVIADEFWKQIRLDFPINSTRISGENRYETAVIVSQAGWEFAQGVIIARGDDFPDALAGAPLAYDLNSPILLTHSESLDDIVKDEIERLNPEFAILLGGEQALSPAVETAIEKMGVPTSRLAGDDRYETAAEIAYSMPTSDKAVIANGTKFADALAIASYAAENTYPILLAKQDEIPKSTSQVLSIYPESLAIGGTQVLSDNLVNQLPNAKRYGGADRFETASIIAMELNPSYKAFVSTGLEFADALTGSVLAAKTDSSFLLVHPEKMQDTVIEARDKLGIYHFTILGGPKAVSPSVEKQLVGVE
ncbi:cell wall-binding repeat-containing protein [Pseudalkalibacillus hwajinpoensis]|uniref:cell wall-binding repeat-containing protein n=1 Tax=Guptibacillus hwajinpoensis TaxID=208199 RepID=UPI00325B4FF0